MKTKQRTTLEFLQQRGDVAIIEDTWYDWFCKDSQLVRRGEALADKLATIAFSRKFDVSKTYVFFKNNCPMAGALYDDFRICDLETGDVLYTICPAQPKERGGGAYVYGFENGFKDALAKGKWSDIVTFFMGGQSK